MVCMTVGDYCGGRILWWGDLWGEYSVDGEYAYVGSYKWEGIFWLGNIVMGRIFWVWDILDGGVLMGNTNPNLFFMSQNKAGQGV